MLTTLPLLAGLHRELSHLYQRTYVRDLGPSPATFSWRAELPILAMPCMLAGLPTLVVLHPLAGVWPLLT